MEVDRIFIHTRWCLGKTGERHVSEDPKLTVRKNFKYEVMPFGTSWGSD